MRLCRLAQLLEHKYGLLISESSNTVSSNQTVLNAKKVLKSAYQTWIHGPKDQSLLFWSEQGYDLAKAYVQILARLADSEDPQNNFASSLFWGIHKALEISARMKNSRINNLGHFKDKVKDQTRGLTEGVKRELNLRESKARTALRMLDSVLSKQFKVLQSILPAVQSVFLPEEHQPQQRREVSKDEIRRFLQMSPYAQDYDLDLETVSYLLQSKILMYFPQEREALVSLINAVNRGENPRVGPEILRKIKQIKEEMAFQTPNTVHELPEEEAQQVFHSLQDPAENWSHQMQERKKEVEKERQEDQSSEESLERLAPEIEKRDKEHQEKQIEEDRNRHIRRDGTSFLLDQLLLLQGII